MTELTIVQPTEPPYNGAADSLGCWGDGIAFRRLEHLIGRAFETFMAAHQANPELSVRRHIALELARQHPDVLDAVRGGK